MLLSSKSAMKIFASQFSALMIILRSARAGDRDPATDQARGQRGHPPVALPHVPRPGREFGQRPPTRSASRTARDVGSSARPGPSVPCRTASSSSAPAVSACSQPPSQDAPTSTPGTLGALLMRYPSQTCVRLAPQRRNSPTATLVRDRQTIASRAAARMGPIALASWPAEHGSGPPDAARVRNSAHLPDLECRTGNSGMIFKASRPEPALINISAKIAKASRAHLEAGRFRREAIEDLGEADHMTLLLPRADPSRHALRRTTPTVHAGSADHPTYMSTQDTRPMPSPCVTAGRRGYQGSFA